MPYINVDFSFTEHPKTKRLIGRLGECADAYPIRLWLYCARVHPKDGRLNGYTEAEIEAVIGWRGAQNAAISALVDIGFIGKDEGGYFCVDWLQHQGHIIAFSRRGKANAKKRWSGYASGIATGNAKSKSGNAPTLPSLPTKPKEHLGPSRPPTDVQLIVELYKTAKGIDRNDTAWNKANFKRFSKAASDLLASVGGDVEKATDYLAARGAYLAANGLEWTLETIAKNAADNAPTGDAKAQSDPYAHLQRIR